jgi:hypothetical protein
METASGILIGKGGNTNSATSYLLSYQNPTPESIQLIYFSITIRKSKFCYGIAYTNPATALGIFSGSQGRTHTEDCSKQRYEMK